MSMPALTIGGSKPAEIAVPTKALPPVEVSDTPNTVPAAADTMMEITRLKPCPSGNMAELGHLYVLPTSPSSSPNSAPVSSAAPAILHSLMNPVLKSRKSDTRYPKVIPRMGPMIGDTNMDATMNTTTLVVRPPAAMMDAPAVQHAEWYNIV